jgi:hypothetical protein
MFIVVHIGSNPKVGQIRRPGFVFKIFFKILSEYNYGHRQTKNHQYIKHLSQFIWHVFN